MSYHVHIIYILHITYYFLVRAYPITCHIIYITCITYYILARALDRGVQRASGSVGKQSITDGTQTITDGTQSITDGTQEASQIARHVISILHTTTCSMVLHRYLCPYYILHSVVQPPGGISWGPWAMLPTPRVSAERRRTDDCACLATGGGMHCLKRQALSLFQRN